MEPELLPKAWAPGGFADSPQFRQAMAVTQRDNAKQSEQPMLKEEARVAPGNGPIVAAAVTGAYRILVTWGRKDGDVVLTLESATGDDLDTDEPTQIVTPVATYLAFKPLLKALTKVTERTGPLER